MHITIHEVTVIRHLEITYYKNDLFSSVFRKPFPGKTTGNLLLRFLQIQTGSPVIMISFCFQHFTVPDGQYLFRFHVTVD